MPILIKYTIIMIMPPFPDSKLQAYPANRRHRPSIPRPRFVGGGLFFGLADADRTLWNSQRATPVAARAVEFPEELVERRSRRAGRYRRADFIPFARDPRGYRLRAVLGRRECPEKGTRADERVDRSGCDTPAAALTANDFRRAPVRPFFRMPSTKRRCSATCTISSTNKRQAEPTCAA